MLTRRQFTSAVAGTSLLTACAPRRSHAEDGVLRAALAADVQTLVPLANTAGGSLSAKVTEGLLRYEADMTPVGQLAASWAFAPDGSELRFAMRPGVRWHDGRPFTAADAAYSLELLREYNPIGRQAFKTVRSIEPDGPANLRIRLDKPASYLLSAFSATTTPILPRHLYLTGDPLSNPHNNAPIGTGPFRLEQWQHGSHILYRRNPDYWDRGRPYLKGLIALLIKDPGARLAAIQSHGVSLIDARPAGLARLLQDRSDIRLQRLRGALNANIHRIEFNLRRPLLRDILVRRAIAHAIDRDFVRDALNFGFADVAPRPIAPALTRFALPDPPLHGHDPALAERLLDQAGHPRRDDGVRLRLTIDYFPNEPLKRLAQYAKVALAKVGIEAVIRNSDQPSYLKRIYTDHDFDLCVNGVSNLYDPTAGVQRFYHSRATKPGVPFTNAAGYRNARVDALLDAAAVEMDADRRRDQFAQFQRIVETDLPDVNIISPWDMAASSGAVSGFDLGGEGLGGNFSRVRMA